MFHVLGLIKKLCQVQSPQLVDLCKEFGLVNDDIAKEVSDEHILEIYQLLVEWRQVAVHLGLTQGSIEDVEFAAKPDEELMGLNMLQKWKRHEIATYQILLEALIKCELSESAKQLCSK